VLQQLHKLLKPEGRILIRIPVADSYLWRKYGVEWDNLDAPRHFFLHTTRSMAYLAKEAGLVLEQVEHHASWLDTFYSEQRRRDLMAHELIDISAACKKEWKRQAKRNTATHDGDEGCFVLRKQ